MLIIVTYNDWRTAMKEGVNLFWNASLEDLKNGYTYEPETGSYLCLICGQTYQEGVVYPSGEQLVTAAFAVRRHLQARHGSMFDYLLSLDKRAHGLSELQKEILILSRQGLTDERIAARLGNRSKSTIRNHRFVLRQKYREAKALIAVMELLGSRDDGSDFVDFPPDFPVQDGRIMITRAEKETILRAHFAEGEVLKLLRFPRKEKKKMVILQKIAELFERQRTYSEKEINATLAEVYADYVTLRRYLIDYGFLGRSTGGREYWRV
jgi:hypothetical protein